MSHWLKEYKKNFKHSVVSGFGWAIGVTIGFALISTLLVFVFNQIDTIPVFGNWIADIIEATNESLIKRSPVIPQ